MQGDGNLVIYNGGGTAIWDWGSGKLGGGGGGGGVIGDDYPANLKSAAQDSLFDPWRFYNRECTSFVAWRLNSVNGVAFNDYYRGPRWGDAQYWGGVAQSLGIPVDSTPVRGAVAWEPSGDHVAWVADVRSNGTVDIEEYNEHLNGTYDTRNVAASSFEYIHIS
jgi:surface antigen